MLLGVEHPLQVAAEVRPAAGGLHGLQAVKHAPSPLLQQSDGEIEEVHGEHVQAMLGAQDGEDAPGGLLDLKLLLGRVGPDEERDLVAQALHPKEALGRQDRQDVALLSDEVSAAHRLLLTGKKRRSLGARWSRSRRTSRESRGATMPPSSSRPA